LIENSIYCLAKAGLAAGASRPLRFARGTVTSLVISREDIPHGKNILAFSIAHAHFKTVVGHRVRVQVIWKRTFWNFLF
jgi:hypothetical protein